jgi:hypothetical protein
MTYVFPFDKSPLVAHDVRMARPKLPPERKLHRIGLMLSDAMVARLDDARRSGWPDVPSRGEAVRRLLDEGLVKREAKAPKRTT